MSLNGLDTAQVKEAYNIATTEVAGWFLLKYISRDVVQLLGSGTAGVNEAKAVVLQYEEKSPLYGLIMFRRRKVLIKYVPEGTTRLLQARTTVHFQDVLEKFSPHEALLEITNADSLNDTTLAAAFPLHAGASAVSSIKLDEITEDAEETSSPPRPRGPQHAPSLASMSSRKAALERSALYKRSGSATSTPPPVLRVTSDDGQVTQSPGSGEHEAAVEKEDTIQSSVHQSSPLPSPSSHSPPTAHVAPFDTATRPQLSPDLSRTSDHMRNPSKESFDLYQFPEYKPKIKLGPRPVNVSDKRRGHSTINASGRPTSTLPAGLQMRTKSSESTTLKTPEPIQKPIDSPMTADVASVPAIPPPPPVPVTPNEQFPPRPSSRGSSRSMPSRLKGAMTPEKQRLLKAVEMRKKQMRKSQPGEQIPVASPPLPSAVIAVKNESVDQAAPASGHDRNSTSTQSAKKSDSGVDMGYDEQNERQDSAAEESHREETPRRPIARTTQSKEHLIHSMLDRKETSIVPVRDAVVSTTRETSAAGEADSGIAQQKGIQKNGLEAESTPSLTPNSEAVTRNLIESEIREDIDSFPSPPGTPNANRESIKMHRTEEQQKRRQGLVIPATSEHKLFAETDKDQLSEDELIDELQNATVHEAKPMAVSRTPATAVFPRRPSLISRNSSPSFRSNNLNTSPNSIGLKRTASQSVAREPRLDDVVNLETLEKPHLQRSLSEITQSPRSEGEEWLSALRKGSIQPEIVKRIDDVAESRSKRSPQTSPKSSSDASFTLHPNITPPDESHDKELTLRGSTDNDPAVMRDRLRSRGMLPVARHIASQRSLSNSRGSDGAVYTVQQSPHNRRDSVSVTARIVRAGQSDESPHKSSELHQSPITINHQRILHSQASRPQNYHHPIDTKGDPEDNASLSPKQRDGSISPTLSRLSVDGKRRSFSRYQRRISTVSETQSEMPSAEESPKAGRTSRFFKRMSALGSRKKDHQNKERSLQPSPTNRLVEDETESKDVPPAVVIGDVNVQFPDSALWKRRMVEIDDTGNVVFTTSKYRFELGSTKRFHLSDFSKVYLPSMDDQELANSVTLVMANKPEASIQCACEDSMAQQHLLYLLTTYHKAWLDV